MSLFNKEIRNPRAAQARSQGPAPSQPANDPFAPDASIISRPADEAAPEGPTAVVQAPPAPAAETPPVPSNPEPAQVQQPQTPVERPLSDTGVIWSGHPTIVLYVRGAGEAPTTIEQEIQIWLSLPEAMRQYNVTEIDRDVYCYEVVNDELQILDIILPDGMRSDILADHDARVAEYLAKITGQAEPSTAVIRQLLEVADDVWVKFFAGIDDDRLQDFLDMTHAELRKRTGNAKKGDRSKGDQSTRKQGKRSDRKDGEPRAEAAEQPQPEPRQESPAPQDPPPAPAPAPAPQPQRAPAPQPRPQQQPRSQSAASTRVNRYSNLLRRG